MSTEAMKLALEEMKIGNYNSAAERLEAALVQPQQEPAAKVDANDEGYWADILPDRTVKVGQLLYAEAPQPAQRKPLTDEQIRRLLDDSDEGQESAELILGFARAIEAAHNIKENT